MIKVNFLHSINLLLPWVIGLSLITLAIYHGGYDFISVDTLYKIEISRMMLNGKMIYKDLFEVNHPMPTYIIWVAVYIASKFSWLNDVFATKALLCSLCLLSVILSHKVMILSDEYKDKYFRFIFIITLFYVTFLLPMHDSYNAQLGQKSHLFFILFLPYLHSFLLTDAQRKQHPYLMLIVGLFAGIGLCVKVYFFIIAAILEIARMLNRKSFSSVLRIETITIAFVALSFLLSIIIFTPEYITEVIPIAVISYSGYASTGPTDWLYFLVNMSPNFIFLLVFVSIKPHSPKYHSLLKVAIAASLFSIIPQTSKWNHASLPTLGIIMLFTAVIISDIVRKLIEDFPDKGEKFNNKYLSQFFWTFLTVAFITQSVTSNISNYQTRKLKHTNIYQIDHFIALSKEYSDKGGAHFLTKSFNPGLSTWIDGDFSLQSYFYSAYIIDGLNKYRKLHQYKKSPQWMRENYKTVEDKVRNRIISDIEKQKPALIIVQNGYKIEDKETKQYVTTLNGVDYIEFLSKNNKFKRIWQQYRLKEVVEGDNPEYSAILSVYVRKNIQE